MLGLKWLGLGHFLVLVLRSVQGRLVESPLVANLRSGIRSHVDDRVPGMSMGSLLAKEDLPSRLQGRGIPSQARARVGARARQRRAAGAQPKTYEVGH